MEFKCEFCTKIFGKKQALVYHKKTAKYCLQLRGASVTYKCELCNKELSDKRYLEKHREKCEVSTERKLQQLTNTTEQLTDLKQIVIDLKQQLDFSKKIIEDKERQILQKDQQIKELQNKLENIALSAVSYNYQEEDPRVIEIYKEDDDVDTTPIITEEKINQSLEPLNLTDNYTIEYREEDGYINVSNLCKAGGKQFKHWNSIDKTKAFLKVLSSSVGISTNELIKYKSGSNSERATWVHPQVAINIAQWISPEFDVKVSGWVYEIMVTGKVDVKNTKSYKQLQKENKDHQLRIKVLENKYLKRHKRTDYKADNVIYVLTTESNKKNNIYIMGKAANLTSRLSVYNKTEEHEVVFYKECLTSEIMSSVEGVIFQKLDQYRQQANRERFILPEGKDISLFTNVIEKCIQFLEEK
jgi:hypothetical protein